MTTTDEPITVHQYNSRFYFGLVVINYHIEDRRPDLEVYEGGKYKHFLTIKIGWHRLNWTFRTNDRYEYLPFQS